MSKRLKNLVLSLTLESATVELNEFIRIRAIYRLLIACDGYVCPNKLDVFLSKLDELEISIHRDMLLAKKYSVAYLQAQPLRAAIKRIENLPVFKVS